MSFFSFKIVRAFGRASCISHPMYQMIYKRLLQDKNPYRSTKVVKYNR